MCNPLSYFCVLAGKGPVSRCESNVYVHVCAALADVCVWIYHCTCSQCSCVQSSHLFNISFQLNPEVSAFQRKFINEVRRCDEMERKLRFLSNELEKAEIEPRPAGNIEAPEPQDMIDLEVWSTLFSRRGTTVPRDVGSCLEI